MTPDPAQPSAAEPSANPTAARLNPLATPAAYTSLHAALREARVAAGMTQRQAAAALDVPQSFVAKSERGPLGGGRRVEAVELPMFAACYGTTVERLLGAVGTDERDAVARRVRERSRMSRKTMWAKGALLRPRPRWGRSRCAWAPVGWVPLLDVPDPSLSARRREVSDLISTNSASALVMLIREEPALLEMFSESGERPLFEAARSMQFTAARALLDAGANPDLPQNWSHPYAWAQTARQAVARTDSTLLERFHLLKAMGGRRAPGGHLPWGGFNRGLWMPDILLDLRDGLHQQREFAFVTLDPEYVRRTNVRY